jgi:hypothetical protein
MHQYHEIQHVHLQELDRLKTLEPPANLMSVQHLELTNKEVQYVCSMDVTVGF